MKYDLKTLDVVIGSWEQTKLIATQDNQFIGGVDLQYRGRRVAEFARLFVSGARRGSGCGAELVRRCEDIARAAGCEAIAATVDPDNQAVLPFYSRLGYVVAYEWTDDKLLLISKKL